MQTCILQAENKNLDSFLCSRDSERVLCHFVSAPAAPVPPSDPTKLQIKMFLFMFYLFIAYCNISLGVASANMCDRPPAQYRCIRELWKMFHCYFPELMLTSSNILFCFVSFESKTRTFSIYNSSSAHILVHAKIHDATHRYKLYRWMKLKPVIWGRLAIFSCCHYGQADHGTSPDPDAVLYGPEPTFNRFDLIGWRRWEASDRRRDEWAVHGEKTETDQEWPGDNRGK